MASQSQQVSPEQLIRGLSLHARTNAHSILKSARAAVAFLQESANVSLPPEQQHQLQQQKEEDGGNGSSLTSFLSGVVGLGGSGAKNDTGAKDGSSPAAASAAYDPSTYTPFTIDPRQLAYLIRRFETSPLVQRYIAKKRGDYDLSDDEDVEDEDDEVLFGEGATGGGSGATSPSVASAALSSISFFWNPSASSGQNQPPRSEATIEQDLVYLYRFLNALPTLRLAPVAQKRIADPEFDYDAVGGVEIAGYCSALVSVELVKVSPSVISDWEALSGRLIALVCENGVKGVDQLLAELGLGNRPDTTTESKLTDADADMDINIDDEENP
ncbi:hypothetical protein HK104_004826, partial [Borealophlyctis nickersoniae]